MKNRITTCTISERTLKIYKSYLWIVYKGSDLKQCNWKKREKIKTEQNQFPLSF